MICINIFAAEKSIVFLKFCFKNFLNISGILNLEAQGLFFYKIRINTDSNQFANFAISYPSLRY